MIGWFAWLQVGIASLAMLVALVNFARRRSPDDLSLGSTALVGLLLLVQVVVAIVAPFVGNTATGDLLEFWMYLITALMLPIAAILWSLADRSRYMNLVLAVVNFSVAVMLYRMLFIWTVQGA